jgi:serine/threonine protein kinase
MDNNDRVKRFYAWRKGELGAAIGKGNYGTVFRCGDGAVVKVVGDVRKSSGSAKLAYREHVMSLLQSVLVLRHHTPHLPLHYGLEATQTGPKALSMSLYLEAFDCSLDASPVECLVRPNDWVALIFQVSSAVLCVAKLLDVCHNDLYPRNVLVRRYPGGHSHRICYNHFGLRHEVWWHSLTVLTDFGVCSSPLLASRGGPEVKRTPVVSRGVVPFGRQPPSAHVLNHTYLPPFSRDFYMLFKWGAFKTKGLPRAPESVALWCRAALDYLDKHQPAFTKPQATLRAFECVFSPSSLATHSLPKLAPSEEAGEDEVEFTVDTSDRAPVLEDCTALLSAVPFSS